MNENCTFTYKELKNGTLEATLTGVGSDCTEIVFPSEHEGKKVTKIKAKTPDYPLLQKVTIPGTVRLTAHFSSHFRFKILVLEEGIKKLPSIDDTIDLEEIYLPQSLEVLGDCALYGARNLKKIYIPRGTKLKYVGLMALPHDKKGLLIATKLLECCKTYRGNLYLPCEGNAHFMLVERRSNAPIHPKTELVYPSKWNHGFANDKRPAITVKHLAAVVKKCPKALQLNTGFEFRDGELFNQSGECVARAEDPIEVYYFYFHGGRWWHYPVLGPVAMPIEFGFRGWRYLSKDLRHCYPATAGINLLNLKDEDDCPVTVGKLNIFSCAEAFNLITAVDTECG